jgi:two-component system cell cycle response regulator DivK
MGKKILVVEDDELNRKLFVSILQEKGYEVSEAEDGQEAVAFIQREPMALILMDIILPKMNGFEVLKTCKEKGLLDNTKIYALTASTEKEILEAGFDGVIAKPVKVLEFLTAVGKILEEGASD